MATDWDAIRAQFPGLHQDRAPGVPLAYLDSAATAQKPQAVMDSLLEHYASSTANVHRGIHYLAESATEAYESARATVARFIGSKTTEQVVFTHGTTEGLNLVAHSFGERFVEPGDEVIVSQMEHHANLVPWQMMCQRRGAEIKWLPVTDDGMLDLDAYEQLLGPKTKLVTVTAVSNVLGTINPVKDLAAMAHAHGARFLVDAAQAVPHIKCDVLDWGCDLMAFSGHKLYGPDGVGVLWGTSELLEALPPFMTGGEMVRKVTFEGASWNELPWKFEAGTPAIAPAIALAQAIEFVEEIGFAAIGKRDRELVEYGLGRLRDMGGVDVMGPGSEHRSSLISFVMDGIHPHDIAQIADRRGVAIRAGHHCAHPLHNRFGIQASARASFSFYNTISEIDNLIESLAEARHLLAK